MRLPFVSRKRYERVSDELERLQRREQERSIVVNVRADTSEFEDALERVRETLNSTGDEFARLQENASRVGTENS